MKITLLTLLAVFTLFSCSDNPMEAESKDPIVEVASDFLVVTDSADEQDSLVHYQYQNLTSWGGIEVWYKETEIVKIRATEKGELGFRETTHFYEEESNYKSVVINHSPNWAEFEEKYPDVDAVGDDRMTYTDDTTETVAHYSFLDSFDLQMIHEAGELMIFVSNENKLVP
ncbi:MAG: hypothetical protein ABF242_00055 [Flavobacteriales bacterium]